MRCICTAKRPAIESGDGCEVGCFYGFLASERRRRDAQAVHLLISCSLLLIAAIVLVNLIPPS